MNKKFTPGPWVSAINGDDDTDGELIVCDEIGLTICEIPLSTKDEANARLIAAAPEMFELLEDIAYCGIIRIEEIKQLLAKITTP